MVKIKDREKFKEAIHTKLVLEVAGRMPEHRTVPVAEKEPRVPCLVGEKIWQDRWGRSSSRPLSRFAIETRAVKRRRKVRLDQFQLLSCRA